MVFCEIDRIAHQEYFPPGQTSNQGFYVYVLKEIVGNVRIKHFNLWASWSLNVHHVADRQHITAGARVLG